MKIFPPLPALVTVVLAAIALASCSGDGPDPPPVTVKIIALNDFHGYLVQDDPANTVSVFDPDAPSVPRQVAVGGGAFMASLIKQLRDQNPNNILVAAGDLIGASPAVSSLTVDEATIDFMNVIGLEVSAVGNHEFDRGKEELRRLQNGGCSADPKFAAQTCLRNGQFSGANFKYLAANVTDLATGSLLFEPTAIRTFGPVTVGFVGLTLKDTPAATRGAAGLSFAAEVPVINAHAEALRKRGVDAVVVLLHQGGGPSTNYIGQQQSCTDLAGALKDIVTNLKGVDVVISGHTHREYICNDVAGTGILLTQASLFGNVVSSIDLTIVPGKGVTGKAAQNLPVVNRFNTAVPRGFAILREEPAAAALISEYAEKTRALREEKKGYTQKPLVRIDDDQNARINVAEHPIGHVIADAFLQAAINPPAGSGRSSIGNLSDTIAFINAGGLRNSLNKSGAVSFDDLFRITPFSNNLFVVELTGAQLLRLLEQQWESSNCGKTYKGICGRIMQPSSNLGYEWNIGQPRGAAPGAGEVVPALSVKVNGQALSLAGKYKVVAQDFLVVDGGDNYSVFLQGTGRRNLELFDLDALFEYFGRSSAASPLPHPGRGRVSCVGASTTPGIACSAIPLSCNWPDLPPGAPCQ